MNVKTEPLKIEETMSHASGSEVGHAHGLMPFLVSCYTLVRRQLMCLHSLAKKRDTECWQTDA